MELFDVVYAFDELSQENILTPACRVNPDRGWVMLMAFRQGGDWSSLPPRKNITSPYSYRRYTFVCFSLPL
jgi:hypothetical protein